MEECRPQPLFLFSLSYWLSSLEQEPATKRFAELPRQDIWSWRGFSKSKNRRDGEDVGIPVAGLIVLVIFILMVFILIGTAISGAFRKRKSW